MPHAQFNIAEFLKERDEALLSGDLDRVTALWHKYNPEGAPSSREIAEIGMHKAITAVISLPLEYRRKSCQWLNERGFKSMDDGDLE